MTQMGKNLSQRHLVHHKSHTDCPSIEAHKQEQKPEYSHILRNACRVGLREKMGCFLWTAVVGAGGSVGMKGRCLRQVNGGTGEEN